MKTIECPMCGEVVPRGAYDQHWDQRHAKPRKGVPFSVVIALGLFCVPAAMLVAAVVAPGVGPQPSSHGVRVVIPEPWEWSLVSGMGLLAFAVWRRFRK